MGRRHPDHRWSPPRRARAGESFASRERCEFPRVRCGCRSWSRPCARISIQGEEGERNIRTRTPRRAAGLDRMQTTRPRTASLPHTWRRSRQWQRLKRPIPLRTGSCSRGMIRSTRLTRAALNGSITLSVAWRRAQQKRLSIPRRQLLEQLRRLVSDARKEWPKRRLLKRPRKLAEEVVRINSPRRPGRTYAAPSVEFNSGSRRYRYNPGPSGSHHCKSARTPPCRWRPCDRAIWLVPLGPWIDGHVPAAARHYDNLLLVF